MFKIGNIYKTRKDAGLTKFWPANIFAAFTEDEMIEIGKKNSFRFHTFEKDDTFLVIDIKKILPNNWIVAKVLVHNNIFVITAPIDNKDIEKKYKKIE